MERQSNGMIKNMITTKARNLEEAQSRLDVLENAIRKMVEDVLDTAEIAICGKTTKGISDESFDKLEKMAKEFRTFAEQLRGDSSNNSLVMKFSNWAKIIEEIL